MTNVHHVAYAVKDIQSAARSFEALGYERESALVNDDGRGVQIQFMKHPDGLRIELVSPAREGSPVSQILEKEKGASTPYHICYEVDDIDKELAELKGNGFIQTKSKAPAPAIDGRNVAFAFSLGAGLIELVER